MDPASAEDKNKLNLEHDKELRKEIIESQKHQVDFLKWKLIAVAGIGSYWLGALASIKNPGSELVVYLPCLIPLICAYLDANTAHLRLRIMVIGCYLKARGIRYETEVFPRHTHSANPFRLETFSIYIVTAALNILIILLPFALPFSVPKPLFIACGAFGLIASIGTHWYVCRVVADLSGEKFKVYSALAGKFLHEFPNRSAVKAFRRLWRMLRRQGALTFTPYSNGLYPAVSPSAANRYTGYSAAWVRDNVYVAYAHFNDGDAATASKTAQAMCKYFQHPDQVVRFEAVISKPEQAKQHIEKEKRTTRPHVKFNGVTGADLMGDWGHAQNDALGYFVWFYALLIGEKKIEMGDGNAAVLARFVQYFKAIEYWKDEDKGHWEEAPKVSASSIGVVLAGLLKLKAFSGNDANLLKTEVSKRFPGHDCADVLNSLIKKGREALWDILPNECNQDTAQKRSYDAALLFLLYPLNVLTPESLGVAACEVAKKVDLILSNVGAHLQGEYGIRRYLLDSFWCKDYKRRIPPEMRTADVSEEMELRDALFEKPEAEWCIFDPTLSAYYGRRYVETKDDDDLRLQQYHLYRSLMQVTGEDCTEGAFNCPELYYKEDGQWQPGDAIPLLWTQANLWVALVAMRDSLKLKRTR